MSLEQYKDASRKDLWDILQIQMQVLQAEVAKNVELEAKSEVLKYANEGLGFEISELEKEMDGICLAVLENRGRVVTEKTLVRVRGVIAKFDLPLNLL